MYKIKATVVKSLGDTRKYPCRFNYKIGDEFIFEGEGVKGRICPLALEVIVPKLGVLRLAGPKYDPPEYYSPLYYAAPIVSDPALAVYDGSGFRNTGAETGYFGSKEPPKRSLLSHPCGKTEPLCWRVAEKSANLNNIFIAV
jgi:uncharacterized repeat protein (TIGR04076 family)